jgi:hypothetical protein
MKMSGRGWSRTSGLLLVRQALLPAELLARRRVRGGVELRDKGSNLDLHVQSVVSCRLDDPGMWARNLGSRASPSILRRRKIDAAGGSLPVGHARVLCLARPKPERCCLCHSPTLRPWIIVCRQRTSGAVDVLRGGVLEPDPRAPSGNWQAKAHAYCQRLFPARSAKIFLSQAGPQLDLNVSS